MSSIGFIGAGNMAGAIINGMLCNKVAAAEDIFVFDVDSSKLEALREKGVNVCNDACEVVKKSRFVFLAVKPQNYSEVLETISTSVRGDNIIISIAAGISINYVLSSLKTKCGCVRVMPNTPLLLGCGATALCPSDNISDEDFDFVKRIFSASGVCQVLPENQMNTVISVNGSSPAYIYLFAKAMRDYAIEQGISESSAMELICSTLKGSAEMLTKSGDDVDTLIRKVSSPGGTTLAALDVLDRGGFYENIKEAMAACTKRAGELGR